MLDCKTLKQCLASSYPYLYEPRPHLSVARLTRRPSYRCQHRLITTDTASAVADWSPLQSPQVLYSNNHLLVVNKPPGWRSTPEASMGSDDDPKCLLSHLRRRQLGGGADGMFLLPLHRLDQPCSGVLLLGKTRRAAARVQSHWGAHVRKLYVCVLDAAGADNDGLATRLHEASRCATSPNQKEEWMALTGRQLPTTRRHKGGTRHGHSTEVAPLKGWSVDMVPVDDDRAEHCSSPGTDTRTIHWRLIRPNTLLVRTNQGSRHMIRALLGMVGCPLAGDLRYGALRPLPDRSVALHAWRLQLPRHLPLGHDTARDFKANIPTAWESFFGLTKQDLCQKLEDQY